MAEAGTIVALLGRIETSIDGVSTEVRSVAEAIANPAVENDELVARLTAVADRMDGLKTDLQAATAAEQAEDAGTVTTPTPTPTPTPDE